MKYYLKTKEECDAIVERNEAFIKAERVVEGFNVCVYDYRLASLGDFVKDEAFELRGLTFVENPKTGNWERNLLMQKFFNIGQCSMDDLLELELDNGEVIRVSETHIFKVKSNSGNINEKFARDLTESDEIIEYDTLTELQ